MVDELWWEGGSAEEECGVVVGEGVGCEDALAGVGLEGGAVAAGADCGGAAVGADCEGAAVVVDCDSPYCECRVGADDKGLGCVSPVVWCDVLLVGTYCGGGVVVTVA